MKQQSFKLSVRDLVKEKLGEDTDLRWHHRHLFLLVEVKGLINRKPKELGMYCFV